MLQLSVRPFWKPLKRLSEFPCHTRHRVRVYMHPETFVLGLACANFRSRCVACSTRHYRSQGKYSSQPLRSVSVIRILSRVRYATKKHIYVHTRYALWVLCRLNKCYVVRKYEYNSSVRVYMRINKRRTRKGTLVAFLSCG